MGHERAREGPPEATAQGGGVSGLDPSWDQQGPRGPGKIERPLDFIQGVTGKSSSF